MIYTVQEVTGDAVTSITLQDVKTDLDYIVGMLLLLLICIAVKVIYNFVSSLF